MPVLSFDAPTFSMPGPSLFSYPFHPRQPGLETLSQPQWKHFVVRGLLRYTLRTGVPRNFGGLPAGWTWNSQAGISVESK